MKSWSKWKVGIVGIKFKSRLTQYFGGFFGVDRTQNSALVHSERRIANGVSVDRELKAKSVLSNALKTEKSFVKTTLQAAVSLRTQGQLDEAISQLKKINSEYPNHKSHRKQLANMLALAGNFEEALTYFLVLADENPEDVTFKLRLADCYTGLKQHQDAIDVLNELFPYAGAKQKTVADRLIHHKNLLSKAENGLKLRIKAGQKKFEDTNINLSDEQQRILSELRSNGVAFTSVENLLSNSDDWNGGLQEYQSFEDDPRVQELIANVRDCENFDEDPNFRGKHVPSKITYDEFFGVLSSDKAISKTLMNDKILEVAWSYYGTACKLRNPLMWINPSINRGNSSGRKGSQLWHRDQEDASILKCFVYYSDVDESSGATEYLLRSCERFQNNQFSFHPFPFSSGYPNQKFFEHKVVAGSSVVANGKAGTVVFLDTNGFHRGGFVSDGQRHISMCTFIRPHSPVFDKGKSIALHPEMRWSELQEYSCT